MKYFWRKPCSLVVFGVLSLGVFAHAQAPAAQQRAAARRFLAHRGLTARRLDGREPPVSMARSLATARAVSRVHHEMQNQLPSGIATTWQPAGPAQTLTASYGAITGRVTSIAIDPADATGNTVYLGTTGGGVWKSSNAASASPTFAPVTDDAGPTDTGISSRSIGAVSVQTGGLGVVLAGTGDPNDALDSYYGSGILRSTDHGATWTTITDANLDDYAVGPSFSFYGEGFSGFAWSGTTANLVVAALTDAYDGTVVNALQSNSVDGLYYSLDAGATWNMSTLTDGPGQIFQSPSITTGSGQGSAVTAVVWNPIRKAFYAAIRYHGYYSSSDGMTWTRLPNQPGIHLSPTLCPEFTGSPGSESCPIFRGALAVQPLTGDMFAFFVDGNLFDQGIWQDVCAASGGACTTNATVMFGTQIPDTELQDGNGHIAQGDYNLWLAAVPSNADTLLYAGTEDIFKRSLAASNVPWRNATNTNTCIAARVAPAQHAVSAVGSLMYFGNDGGLWRTTDSVNQQPTACSADDATHFTNLNGSLGSLAEITSLAQSPGSDTTLLAGEGVNGTAGTTTAQGAWPQVLDGSGAHTAIDPANAQNWFVTSGPGVSISYCGAGGSCVPASFADLPTIGDAQTDSDGQSMAEPAAWMLDPQDSTRMLVATCRVWRGSIAGGVADWAATNAISPVLDDAEAPDCTEGAGQIQSIGASGTIPGPAGSGNAAGDEILYAGMEGAPRGGDALPYGGLDAGHVFTATVSGAQSGPAEWTDLFASPVVNDLANRGQFNPGGFGVSSVVVDSHDTTGQTVYATIQGFSGNGISEPLVYRSTNQGQSWTNITANLPITPVNALVVDPGNANIVYLATDAGVYATTTVATCSTGAEQCWSPYGVGLPDAPVTTLITNGTANDSLLIAGTYGRGAWEMLLASAVSVGSLTSATLSPTALTFGAQSIGNESAPMVITVRNTGSLALLVSGVEPSGDFTETDNCTGISVAADATCAVNVSFAPTALGTRSGELTVLANVPGGQVSAMLSGLGEAEGLIVLAPTQLVFPPTLVGASAAEQYLTVSNTGANTVALQAPSVSGDYQVKNTSCASSEAGQSGCTVGIVFSPKIRGADNGVFSIATGAGNFTAQLQGSGLAPATDALSPTSLNFGAQLVNTASAAKTVTVTNTGDQALTLLNVTVSEPSPIDFVANASACETNLPGHASCSIVVYFAPQTAGARTGSLVISDLLHSGTSALHVALSGSGTAAPGVVSMSPSSLNFGAEGFPATSAEPTSVSKMVSITNNGSTAIEGFALAIDNSAFTFSANTCGSTLAVGKSCSASVTFTPAGVGVAAATLTASGANLAQSLPTALTGTGFSFTMNVPASSPQTVVTGTNAVFQFGIVPGAGSAGQLLLALNCTGASALPAGSTCTANPASLTLTSGATQSVTVTVVTPALATTSALHPTHSNGRQLDGWMLAWLLPLAGLHRRKLPWALLSLVMIASGLAGCATASGGSRSTTGTGTTGTGVPPSAYVLTVTASAPGVAQSVSMTLKLEQ